MRTGLVTDKADWSLCSKHRSKYLHVLTHREQRHLGRDNTASHLPVRKQTRGEAGRWALVEPGRTWAQASQGYAFHFTNVRPGLGEGSVDSRVPYKRKDLRSSPGAHSSICCSGAEVSWHFVLNLSGITRVWPEFCKISLEEDHMSTLGRTSVTLETMHFIALVIPDC